MRIIEVDNQNKFSANKLGITGLAKRAQTTPSSELPHRDDVQASIRTLLGKKRNDPYLKILDDLFNSSGVPSESDVSATSIANYSQNWYQNIATLLTTINSGTTDEKKHAKIQLYPELLKLTLATTGLTNPQTKTLLGYLAPELGRVAQVLNSSRLAGTIDSLLHSSLIDTNEVIRNVAFIQNDVLTSLDKKSKPGSTEKPAVTPAFTTRVIQNFITGSTSIAVIPDELKEDVTAAAKAYAREQSNYGDPTTLTDDQIQKAAQALFSILLPMHEAIKTDPGSAHTIRTEASKKLPVLTSVWTRWKETLHPRSVPPNGTLAMFIKWFGNAGQGGHWLTNQQYVTIGKLVADKMAQNIQAAFNQSQCQQKPGNEVCTAFSNLIKKISNDSSFLINPKAVSEILQENNRLTAGTMGIAKMVLEASTAMRPDIKINDELLQKMASNIITNIENWGKSMLTTSRTKKYTPFEMTRIEEPSDTAFRTEDEPKNAQHKSNKRFIFGQTEEEMSRIMSDTEDIPQMSPTEDIPQMSNQQKTNNQANQTNQKTENDKTQDSPWSYPETIIFGSQILWTIYGHTISGR